MRFDREIVTWSGRHMQPGSIQARASAGFSSWLRAHDVSLLVSAPSVDRVLLIQARDGDGEGDGEGIDVAAHGLARPMGMVRHGSTLWIASAFCVWRFEDSRRGDGDTQMLARAQLMTGDLDVHDLAIDGDAQLLMAVTAYSCVARLDPALSFDPRWRPPFISALASEDRCHLNGLACDKRGLRYVTAFAASDTPEGWRSGVAEGLVYDVVADAAIMSGLVLPHSPRIHDSRLWVLEAGSGAVLRMARGGAVERLIELPGFVRGLSFVGGHPLVTLSRPRRVGAFAKLPLGSGGALDRAACCGVRVLSKDGQTVEHSLDLGAPFDELYDVIALRGVASRFAGVSTDAARRTVILA